MSSLTRTVDAGNQDDNKATNQEPVVDAGNQDGNQKHVTKPVEEMVHVPVVGVVIPDNAPTWTELQHLLCVCVMNNRPLALHHLLRYVDRLNVLRGGIIC